MTDLDDTSGAIPLVVPGAHRTLRVLDGTDAAFSGSLVTDGRGVAVRTDAARLAGWDGWLFAGAEHVAAPLDLVRRHDGHDVLLPWCTEQVGAVIDRRARAGTPLSAGEGTTLIVSLLRGLGELSHRGREPGSGRWWVTDGGRPVFVLGAGEGAATAAAGIIEQLASMTTDQAVGRALSRLSVGFEKVSARPRIPAALLSEWERELLSLAAPQPLSLEDTQPARASEIARVFAAERAHHRPTGGTLRSDRRRGLSSAAPGGAHGTALAFARTLTQVVRSRASDIFARTRGRWPARHRVPEGSAPPRPPHRKRALVVACAAAAVVLLGGVLWPNAEPSTGATGGDGHESPVRTPSPGAEAAAALDEGDGQRRVKGERAGADAEPDGAAAALLEVIAACRAAGDETCAAAVASGSTGVVDALEGAGADPQLQVVDEYGDVAVVQVGPSEASTRETAAPKAGKSLILVLLRGTEKWGGGGGGRRRRPPPFRGLSRSSCYPPGKLFWGGPAGFPPRPTRHGDLSSVRRPAERRTAPTRGVP